MDETTHTAWWQDLQAGDKVILERHGYGGWQRVSTVERLTKTQILITDTRYHKKPYRFQRSSSYEVGGERYNSISLKRWTPEAGAAIQQRNAQDKLFACFQGIKRAHLDGLSTTQCQTLQDCLDVAGVTGQA
jgi:hypothetical protein